MGQITHDEDFTVSATPGQLKAKVAELFRLPANAVDYPWRVLREAGLVTKGGRGPSAAKVTARDAAFLLIAIAGPLPAADVRTSALRYGALPVRDESSLDSSLPESIATAKTFVDVLASVIAAAGDGTLAAYRETAGRKPDQDPRIPTLFDMEFSLYGAYPQAGFRTYGATVAVQRHFSELPKDLDALQTWKPDQAGDDSDLATVNRFTGRTIWALGELIGGPV